MKAIYLNVEDNIYQKVIDFLKLLPKNKIKVVEDNLKSIEEETIEEKSLSEGAKALLKDYMEDEELVAFTALDSEEFYEAK